MTVLSTSKIINAQNVKITNVWKVFLYLNINDASITAT